VLEAPLDPPAPTPLVPPAPPDPAAPDEPALPVVVDALPVGVMSVLSSPPQCTPPIAMHTTEGNNQRRVVMGSSVRNQLTIV
jgi:hypothetical protein